MTTAEGSEELLALCSEATGHLADFTGRLLHDETTYMQHIEHASRASQVADYLRGALALASSSTVAQSFALMRTVMERWAIDSIILLGDRYVQLYRSTTVDVYEATVQRWANGELPSVLEAPSLVGRNRTTMRLVRHGLSSGETPQQVLHPLYFDIDHFDPFFGIPEEQDHLSGGALHQDARGVAERYRRTYNASLRWAAVLETLQLNDLVAAEHVLHLKVHYRFLSAFVHGHHAAYRSLVGTRLRSRYSSEHVATELVLLYAAQFAARYLLALLAMTERPPLVAIEEADRLRELAEELLDRSAHLWFLTNEPSRFDRGQELLDRAAKSRNWRGWRDPLSLPVEEIRYYRNPVKRLERLHESSTELVTGFAYQSPW